MVETKLPIYTAGDNTSFCIINPLGVFLLPPGWDDSPCYETKSKQTQSRFRHSFDKVALPAHATRG